MLRKGVSVKVSSMAEAFGMYRYIDITLGTTNCSRSHDVRHSCGFLHVALTPECCLCLLY